ncbi:MAG: type II secretion system protein [Clostridia bacterium]
MKGNLKERKGITLIALVVTIIILLILAGVTIYFAVNSGLIEKTQEAKNKSEQATQNELNTLNEIYGELNRYLPNEETVENISKTESYVGYYADINADGTVDGIIYADLAVGGSGTWNSNSWSSYEYSQVTEGLKSYYVSSDSYTGFGDNWTKPVLTAIEGSGTKDRFYVMALEDFNPGTSYCWYAAAVGKLDNTISSSTNDFGQGKTNTTTMIAEWNKGENGKYGPQDDRDMWGVIQKADNAGKTWDLNKWFVPSKAEWATFGDMAFTKMEVTAGNCGDYGLKGYYWSSAQSGTNNAYSAFFGVGSMGNYDVYDNNSVRLSATF